MAERGETAWQAWLCENLAGPDERVRTFSIPQLAECADVRPLNILILQCTDLAWKRPPCIPFIHEDEFTKRIPKKGLITKREVRLLYLAAMRIRPDSLDLGHRSWLDLDRGAMMASERRVYAVEIDPEGVEVCHENLRHHGVDNVRVITGRAPEALADLETPDSVFVGGNKESMDEILNFVLDRLRDGGHVVANAITGQVPVPPGHRSASTSRSFIVRGKRQHRQVMVKKLGALVSKGSDDGSRSSCG
jgi:precorrin-6Y C5,15-methyltransferase (decarboxylating)